MMNNEKTVLRQDEIQRLEKCLREPEFRGLLLEYVRDIEENGPKYESEMKKYAFESMGLSVDFLHPQPGFVLKGSSSNVYLNLCSESKVSKAVEREGESGAWDIPYGIPPSRPHLHEGKTVTLYDVLFHPFSLKKAIKNRRFKTALKETAIEAAIRMDASLSKETFTILPKVQYMGKPHPILLKPQTPTYTLKYRETDPFSQAAYGKSVRPEAAILEIHLPEFTGAANIDLDVTRRSLTLKTTEPVAYHLNVPFSYPVDEENGSAKFEKSTRKLIVTVPILPSKKMERLISFDSGIDSDGAEMSSSSPSNSDLSEEGAEDDDEDNEDKNAMKPDYRYDMVDDVISLTLEVKNVDSTSVVKIPFSQERLRGYRIRFSSMGAGMVRYDYALAFAFSFKSDLPQDLEEPSVDFWDNNITIDIPVTQSHTDILVGKNISELKVQLNPSLEALRTSQNKFQHLKKEVIDERKVEKTVPKERHSSGESEGSVDGCFLKEENNSRFSVTQLDSEDDIVNLPPLPSPSKNPPQPSCSVRGILKRRMRSYSESQADQLRRWEEAAASLSRSSNLLKDFVAEEGEEEEEDCSAFKEGSSIANSYGKKSVRFNDHVQRQIFRKNASILTQRRKDLKNEQKRMKNALRQRRASEGDAQKESCGNGDNLSDSGVEVTSTAEDTEEDNPPPETSTSSSSSTKTKNKKSKRKSKKEEILTNIFQQAEQLMFELDIE